MGVSKEHIAISIPQTSPLVVTSGNGVHGIGDSSRGSGPQKGVPHSSTLFILRAVEDTPGRASESLVPPRSAAHTSQCSEQVEKILKENSVATIHDSTQARLFHLTRRRSGKTAGSTGSDEPGRAGVRKTAFLLALRKDKRVLLVPLLMVAICMGLSLWGVFAAATVERTQRLQIAQNRAQDKAQSIESELRACFLPVKVMQSFVTRYPNFPTLSLTFPSLADELLSLTAAGSIANMQLAPLGVVWAVQPLLDNEKVIGHDLLADPKSRNVALGTIAAHNLTLAGPYMLLQGYMGAPARYPIYVPNVEANETFGMDVDSTNCTICYDAQTRTKFWGFATVMIHWQRFVHDVVRIDELSVQGLRYRLSRRDDLDPSALYVLSGQENDLHDPVLATISVPNNVWTLEVTDSRGWTPNWMWPLAAMVIVMSLVLSALVGMAMVGRAQQRLLLQEVLSANEKLEDAALVLLRDKERIEALMSRQYDLIQCLGGDPKEAAGERTIQEMSSNPADKIERMRRKLLSGLRMSHSGRLTGAPMPRASLSGANAANGGAANGGAGGEGGGGGGGRISTELELREMIGEGTFGKVYKGLWRGTEVAIKTIILPTNMSGKEKREKMAVMEAAISSSLAHPNVVATYTYHIKPLKDSASEHDGRRPSEDLTASAIIVGGTVALSGTTFAMHGDPLAPFKADLDEANGGGYGGEDQRGIHSYEVQLVLEYCDKGCLREALDGGLFFGATGLNYPAILDTAADVAKALLHLHFNDVLHGDLKADNVMLKSCGGVGRGILAKVADFGLAVKMDAQDKTHMSNMFQGTPTHMAPEVLLHGQVSKAADVYAYGITLWEMFTGGHPYQGVPGALLGHTISRENKRPNFPMGTPAGYRELAERCWNPDASQRPTFDEILSIITTLRADQALPTPALTYAPLTPEQRNEQRRREREGPAASLRARLSESGRGSASAPLPKLHHHFRRKSAGTNYPPGHPMYQPPGAASSDGSQPRSTSSHRPEAHRSSGGGGSHRSRSRSRKGDDPMIMVGHRNVSLSNAITSKSVVLEPICEARYEDDPDAPTGDATSL